MIIYSPFKFPFKYHFVYIGTSNVDFQTTLNLIEAYIRYRDAKSAIYDYLGVDTRQRRLLSNEVSFSERLWENLLLDVKVSKFDFLVFFDNVEVLPVELWISEQAVFYYRLKNDKSSSLVKRQDWSSHWESWLDFHGIYRRSFFSFFYGKAPYIYTLGVLIALK